MSNKSNKRKVLGAFLGTIVEYYDYCLYGFSASIIGAKFFPVTDKITSLMYVYLVYASSYLSKPLGSLIFSRIGDLYGRKIALRITMIGIAFPTVTIGLLPEYSSIGIVGIYILVICKFLQGFFIAGEYDGAAIYVIEHFGKNKQFTASAFTRSTGVLGLLLGIAATNFFNSSLFPDWGWRIPFLLSMPLAILTIYYRKFLEETPVFTIASEQQTEFMSVGKFMVKYWKSVILVIFLAGGFGATYQISVIFMKEYLPIILPQASNIMTSFSVIIVLAFGMSMPLSGLIADRIGSYYVIKYSLISTFFNCLLLTLAIKMQILNLAIISCLFLAISVAPFNALSHGIITKAFAIKERYRGVGIGHTIGSMLMSGTANYICIIGMKELNFQLFPILYIMFFATMVFIASSILAKKTLDI